MRFVPTACLVASCALMASAAEPPAATMRSMTLAQCIDLALAHNYDVQIQRLNPEIARFTLEGVYGNYDPTFSFSAKHNFNSSPGGTDSNGVALPPGQRAADDYVSDLTGLLSWGMTYDINSSFEARDGNTVNASGQYTSSASITLTQHILKNFLIDDTRQQILFNKQALKITELGVEMQIMTTVTQVQQAYYDLIYAFENVKVQEKALELADRLLAENKKRVEVGALAPLDEKQAESQRASSQADLLAAQQQLAAQENTLKGLLTDDYTAWHDTLVKPAESLLAIIEPLDVQDSWRKALALRPDLKQSKATLEQEEIQLRYTRNQVLPILDLSGTVGHNGLGPNFYDVVRDLRRGDNPRHGYGVVFSVPLSNRGAKNKYEATKAQKQQALLQLKKLEQGIIVSVDNDIKLARSNYQRVDATREARLYAEAALDAEQKKLASGKSTSFIVLQLQRDLTTARSAEIQALADYNKSIAQLALDEGTTLDKVKMQVQVK